QSPPQAFTFTATGPAHPFVWGIALFPEPEDFTVSLRPCQGPISGTEVFDPETRTSSSRSPCGHEKRMLAYLSGFQRVLHADPCRTDAWTAAFPQRVAVARWRHQQLRELSIGHRLCQAGDHPAEASPPLVVLGDLSPRATCIGYHGS